MVVLVRHSSPESGPSQEAVPHESVPEPTWECHLVTGVSSRAPGRAVDHEGPGACLAEHSSPCGCAVATSGVPFDTQAPFGAHHLAQVLMPYQCAAEHMAGGVPFDTHRRACAIRHGVPFDTGGR